MVMLPSFNPLYQIQFGKSFPCTLSSGICCLCLPNTLCHKQDMYDSRSVFNQSKAILNSEFSFFWTGCLTKAKESSLPCYFLIASGRVTDEFMPLPKAFVQSETKTTLYWIRTWVPDSISYDSNHRASVINSLQLYHFSSILL